MLTPMSFGMPELLIYVVPAFAGIIGSRYLTRLANFCLMVVVFQFDLAILLGQLRAAVFTPYTVICITPALAGLLPKSLPHFSSGGRTRLPLSPETSRYGPLC